MIRPPQPRHSILENSLSGATRSQFAPARTRRSSVRICWTLCDHVTVVVVIINRIGQSHRPFVGVLPCSTRTLVPARRGWGRGWRWLDVGFHHVHSVLPLPSRLAETLRPFAHSPSPPCSFLQSFILLESPADFHLGALHHLRALPSSYEGSASLFRELHCQACCSVLVVLFLSFILLFPDRS